MAGIDKDKLRELASDPNSGVKEICAGLGIADRMLQQRIGRVLKLFRRRRCRRALLLATARLSAATNEIVSGARKLGIEEQ
jgi:hypothetical protein